MVRNRIKKIINIGFITAIFIVICYGTFHAHVFQFSINFFENRLAYMMPKFNLTSFFNENFQDNVELAYSDQLPLANYMKKWYQHTNNYTFDKVAYDLFKDNCSNKYIRVDNILSHYDCQNGNFYNLMYSIERVNVAKTSYDKRIANINEIISGGNWETYVYYIERDSDIDFTTNEKSGVYEYLKANINTPNVYRFEVPDYNTFNKYFYKYDHHWNHYGAYKAYQQLVKILTKDDPLLPKDEVLVTDSFSGSKSNYNGYYKEPFIVYRFDLPDYNFYVNGNEDKNYFNQELFIKNKEKYGTNEYATYYGGNYGEVIYDNHDDSKENILIVGESYDNAVVYLLASHFNKSYVIDLRVYEKEMKEKMHYQDYIEKHHISKVLIIGNIGFFNGLVFNMEA